MFWVAYPAPAVAWHAVVRTRARPSVWVPGSRRGFRLARPRCPPSALAVWQPPDSLGLLLLFATCVDESPPHLLSAPRWSSPLWPLPTPLPVRCYAYTSLQRRPALSECSAHWSWSHCSQLPPRVPWEAPSFLQSVGHSGRAWSLHGFEYWNLDGAHEKNKTATTFDADHALALRFVRCDFVPPSLRPSEGPSVILVCILQVRKQRNGDSERGSGGNDRAGIQIQMK